MKKKYIIGTLFILLFNTLFNVFFTLNSVVAYGEEIVNSQELDIQTKNSSEILPIEKPIESTEKTIESTSEPVETKNTIESEQEETSFGSKESISEESIEESATIETSEIRKTREFNEEGNRDITQVEEISSLLPSDSKGRKTILNDFSADQNGVPFSEKNPLKEQSDFQIHYQFVIPDEVAKKINNGDYFDFKLPVNQLVSPLKAQVGDLEDSGTKAKLGSYSTDMVGNGKIIFNERMKEYQGVNGKITFTMKINEGTNLTAGKYEVIPEFVVKSEPTSLYVITNQKEDVKQELISQTKDDKGYDVLNWKVTINPNRKELKNAQLTMTLKKSLTNVLKDIQVEKVVAAKTFLNGTTQEEEILTYTEENNSVKLPNTDRSIVIYYSARPVYGTNGTLDSTASLKSQGISSNSKVPVTVHHPEYVKNESVNYDETTQLIDWKITYNIGNLKIPQEAAWFEYDYKHYSKYVADSIKVTPDIPYEITKISDSKIRVQFKEAVNETITIKTKSILNKGIKDNAYSYVYYSGGEKIGSVKLPKEVNKNSNVKVTGTEENRKIVKWSIKVNEPKNDKEGVVNLDKWRIHSKINGEEDFDYSTLKVNNLTDKNEVPKNEYTFSKINEKEFTIKYLKETSDKFEIIIYSGAEQQMKYQNNVAYNYVSTGTDFEKKEVGYYTPKTRALTGATTGEYLPATNEIEWSTWLNTNSTGFSYDNELFSQVPDDQEIIVGSQKLFSRSLSSDNPRDVTKTYPNAMKVNKETNTMTTEFPVLSTMQFKVVFKTKLKDPKAIPSTGAIYRLDAVYNDQNTKDLSLVGVLDGELPIEHFVRKTGKVIQLADDKQRIDWTVTFNPYSLPLSNVKLEDRDWIYQKVNSKSISLFSKDKLTGKTIMLSPVTDYHLDFTEKGFYITFLKDIDSEVSLTYNATPVYPPNSLNKTISIGSSVYVAGDNFSTKIPFVTANVDVIVPPSSGEIEGLSTSLIVNKLDKKDSTRLANAEFTLYRGKKIDSNKIVDRQITDDSGSINFDDLVSGNYLLVEKKAPEGYFVSNELEKGKLINIPSLVADQSPIVVDVTNQKISDLLVDLPVETTWTSTPASYEKPNFNVSLLQNDVVVGTEVLSKDNNFKTSFENVREYDDSGQKYTYKIEEVSLPNFVSKISGDQETGFVIDHQLVSKIDYKGTKI